MRKRSPMLDPKSPKGGAICVSPFEGIVFPSPEGEESIQLFHKFSLLTYKGQLPARVKRIAQRILHFPKLQAEPNFKGELMRTAATYRSASLSRLPRVLKAAMLVRSRMRAMASRTSSIRSCTAQASSSGQSVHLR